MEDVVGEMLLQVFLYRVQKREMPFCLCRHVRLTQHLFMMKSELLKRLGEDEYEKTIHRYTFFTGEHREEQQEKRR
ncbi:MAG: hypothetical protein ACLR1D_04960 [Dialister sp.]